MDCCQCKAIETHFDRNRIKKKVEQYHTQGMLKGTKILAKAIADEGIEGKTLLDVGGGVGAIEYELFKCGISQATNVEASAAYLEAAEKEASAQGFADKITFTYGNFVDLASQLPNEDIVTLDRVVCCYDDMQSLVQLSASKAKRIYGIVYPRDNWWVKLAFGFENLLNRLRGSAWRMFIHPTREVDRIIKETGMRQRYYKVTYKWQIVVYIR
jgi:magnesium-protoporphyrin O-methyltransferase